MARKRTRKTRTDPQQPAKPSPAPPAEPEHVHVPFGFQPHTADARVKDWKDLKSVNPDRW